MKKQLLTYAAALAMVSLGAGCHYNEDNFDGFEKGTEVSNVIELELTLTDDDYKSISSNSANKALAAEEGVSSALAALATERYFSGDITAAKYLPAFLTSAYPSADNTSSIKVTYNTAVGLPEEIAAIKAAKAYEVSTDDYQRVWGEAINAAYFTPGTPAETWLPVLLKAGLKDAAANDYAVVSYQYSPTEPSTGGDEEVKITAIGSLLEGVEATVEATVSAACARGFVVADKTGAVLVYLNAPGNYSLGDVVRITGTPSLYNGGMQFGGAVEISLVGRTADFAFPANPAVMNGAALDAYLTNVEFKYATMTGTLSISGNYYNLNVDGASTAVGSLYYPTTGLIDKELNGKRVTVNGYLSSVSKSSGAPKFANMIVTEIAEEGQKPAFTPVGVVAASTAKADYAVRGQVAAMYDRGLLVNDGTGSILVYNSALKGKFAIGELVTVSGGISPYAGLNQYSASAEVEKVGEGSFKYPAIRELTGAEMDAYLEMPTVQYVRYTGTLSISGNYYNVAIADAATAVGSLSYVPEGMVDPSLNGKQIVVEGYSIGVSGSKYVNTMATSVTEASAAAAMNATRASVYTEERVALYCFDGSSWTVAAGAAIVNPSDYAQMGMSNANLTAEQAATYLPRFLELKYPYAQAEDSYFVAYNLYANGSTAMSADQYTFDGGAWVKNNGIGQATDQFVRSSGVWNWDPSVRIVLPVEKNNALSMLYYQTAVDWVLENVENGDKYVTSYGNNDYYSGATAYQCNLDWRVAKAREQYPEAYDGMSDDEVSAALREHTIEVFAGVLAILHPDAVPVEGIEVTYTLQMGVYTGTTAQWLLVYKVIGQGEFEFVSFEPMA